MRTNATKLGAALMVMAGATTLTACSDDSQVLGPTPQATATIYVVHGINGTDLGAAEALPVDVFISGQGCVLEDVRFRDIAGPLALPTGTYDIRVQLAAAEPCTGDVAIQAAGVQLADGGNVSITAHLAEGGSPTASLFANDVAAATGKTKISPRHAADFGPVDIVVNGSAAYENVPNGASATASLDPGTYTVAIQTPDNTTTAFEADLNLEAGTLYAAYAVGTVAKGTFEVLLQAIDLQ
jgi:hypothetical protein